MRHIKRFFESVKVPDCSIEDFEDIFLELIDAGFRILNFNKGYVDPKTGEAIYGLKQGSVLGYTMLLTAEPEDDEEDYDSDGKRERYSKFDYIDPENLTEVQEDFQRISVLYPMVISCLKRVNTIGELKIYYFPRPSYFKISVIPKGEPVSVSKREEDYHNFFIDVKDVISKTLYHDGEFEIEIDQKEETIKIKFMDNLTRGRFNTVINNLKVLETGVKNSRRFSRFVYDFEMDSSFVTKSAEIKFKSGKRKLF